MGIQPEKTQTFFRNFIKRPVLRFGGPFVFSDNRKRITMDTRFRRAMQRGDQRIVAVTLASDARRD